MAAEPEKGHVDVVNYLIEAYGQDIQCYTRDNDPSIGSFTAAI